MPGQCCVFQIFDDGGAYDKRYDEIIRPAITAAGLEPYSDVATSVALLSLTRKSYVKSESLEDYEGGRFYAYWLMPEGRVAGACLNGSGVIPDRRCGC